MNLSQNQRLVLRWQNGAWRCRLSIYILLAFLGAVFYAVQRSDALQVPDSSSVSSVPVASPIRIVGELSPDLTEIQKSWNKVAPRFAPIPSDSIPPSASSGFDRLTGPPPPTEAGRTLPHGFSVEPAILRPPPCGRHTSDYVYWIPARELPQAASLLGRAQNLLDTGKPFDCEGTDCKIMIDVLSPAGEYGRSWALCQVRYVSGVVGAPHSCDKVVFDKGGDKWIRVVLRDSLVNRCQTAAYYTTAGFMLEYTVVTAKEPEKFLKTLTSHLAAPPLSLKVAIDAQTGRNAVAVASYRVSPFLKGGYRELVEIRLSTNKPSGSGKRIFLSYSGIVFVSKQNSSALTDYRGPSEAERAQYLAALEELTTNAFKTMCSNIAWRDSYTLNCDLSE